MAFNNTHRSASYLLLETARNLFYKNGIIETSVNEIIKKSGVSRTTLYNKYGSKQALVLATLKHDGETWRKWFFSAVNERLCNSNNGIENILYVLEDWFLSDNYNGCFFMNSVSGHDDAVKIYKDLASEHKKYMLDFLFNIAKESNIYDPRNFAERLLIIIDGVIICRTMNKTKSLLDHSRVVLNFLIDGHNSKAYKFNQVPIC